MQILDTIAAPIDVDPFKKKLHIIKGEKGFLFSNQIYWSKKHQNIYIYSNVGRAEDESNRNVIITI